MTSSRSRSGMVSVTIHAGAMALLLLASKQMVPPPASVSTVSLAPLIAPYIPHPSSDRLSGGGGGAHQLQPATEGKLPKIARRQIVPPAPEILNPHPKLALEMTIEAPPETALPDKPLAGLGNPLSGILNDSAGKGGPLGIGNGNGTGIGDARGPKFGPGDSLEGTVYRSGKGITLPIPLHEVEPEFTDEARRARHQGVVILRADIDATGHARNVRVVQSLGMGLDERAVNALALWLFKPGTKDGKPVAVSALFQVGFHLF